MRVRHSQGWKTFMDLAGQEPDMIVFASALWDIARCSSLCDVHP